MGSTYSNLIYHIVFSTKHREPLIDDDLKRELYPFIGGIVRAEGGVLMAIGGMADHVHLILRLKPIHALSAMMHKIKGSSSRWVNGCQPTRQFAWQEGYGAFSASGYHMDRLIGYVENQAHHHRQRDSCQEMTRLLERYGLDYDESAL